MKDEQFQSKGRTQSLDERLANDPWMRERIHQIADMREEMIRRGCTLDEIEDQVTEQIRLLGQELLSGIAREKSERISEEAQQQNPGATRDAKKK